MKLKSLLNGIEGLKAKGNLDTDVKGITHNSKNVKVIYLYIFYPRIILSSNCMSSSFSNFSNNS